ncbi:MAG: beta-ketoacyl synthase chain length factor [Myxococcaceae bacterium]
MRAAIHGLGTADAPRTDPDPRVNRLPRLDRMAFAAVREALGGRALPDSLALVFGTGYGALAATEAFLQSVASRGMAYGSATAFHQSVHHSPAGQLSLLLGIRGPVLTVSQREISGEAALRVGLTLLDRFEFVLVVAADEKTAALEAAYRAFGGLFQAGEGAAAILLGRGEGSLWIERCELFSHPTSVRRFASPIRFGPRLAAALTSAHSRAVSIAAPTGDVERHERAVVGRKVQILQDQAALEQVGFHPSAGLVRSVLAAQYLLTSRGESACVLHGLALGGAQSITVLRRDS